MTSGFRFLSHSEAETDELGRRFADSIATGLTLGLFGDLGAGKTRFVRALCAGLGIDTQLVNSPTFVLMQLYMDGRLPVAHFDAYRLADPEEFLTIGAGDYVNSPGWLSLVEWAERVQDVLPEDRIDVHIRHVTASAREFTISGSGPDASLILTRLRDSLNGSATPSEDAKPDH